MSSFEFENSNRPEEPVLGPGGESLDTKLDPMLDALLGEWLRVEWLRVEWLRAERPGSNAAGDAAIGGGHGSPRGFDPGEIYRSVLKRSKASVFTDLELEQAASRGHSERLQGAVANPQEGIGQGGLVRPSRGRAGSEGRVWRTAAIGASIAASIAASIGGLSLIGRWVQVDRHEQGGVGQASLEGSPSGGLRGEAPLAKSSREGLVADSQATGLQATGSQATGLPSLESQILPEQGFKPRDDSRIAGGGLDSEPQVSMLEKPSGGGVTEKNQEIGKAQGQAPKQAYNQAQGAAIASAVPSSRVLSLGTQEDREIVSVIDSQFQQIWKSLGMEHSGMLTGAQVSLEKRGLTADRVARLLLQRVATASELEAIRLDKLSEDSSLDKLVAGWISSDEFDRVWSASLANFYMGGRAEPSQQAVLFREWLATQIRDDVPLAQVQRQVLLGLSQVDHPAYFLVNYWSDRGDRSSLPKVAWVGYDESKVRRLEGLSQLFLTVTSNPAMVCTQCHGSEGSAEPSWLTDREAIGNRFALSDSVDFDSIAALMVGIAQPGESELFRRQQDDQVRKVAARFPDGKRVGTELTFEQAIEGWLEQGSSSQSGLMNAIWKDFFGVGLESAFGLDRAVALEARRDLAGYLGKQIVERRAGLRQVVYWMLMSEPARQSEEPLTYAQYMVMDTQRLEDYLQRQGVFKSLVLDVSRSALRDEAALVGYASALFPEQSEGLERSFLAQPSIEVQGGKKRSSEEGSGVQGAAGSSKGQEPWARDVLHAELGYRIAGDQARRWASLLSASELSDSALIDHAYLLTKHRFATAREFRAWSSTSWTKSERTAGILRLLMGVESFEP